VAALSDAQLKQIADRIFVMRDRATTRLPKPTPTGPGGFKSALDPLATQADFKDAGIGILDFTVDPKTRTSGFTTRTRPSASGAPARSR